MPLVFRDGGYRFHFFSNEGDPREPPHVHVTRDGADAKFWLFPIVTVAYNRGFSAKTQADLLKIVEARRTQIEGAWNEHFG